MLPHFIQSITMGVHYFQRLPLSFLTDFAVDLNGFSSSTVTQNEFFLQSVLTVVGRHRHSVKLTVKQIEWGKLYEGKGTVVVTPRFHFSICRSCHRAGGDLEISVRHRHERRRRLLLIFVFFTVLIGLPMLISEFVIGRGAGKEAISAYQKLAPNSQWVWIGRLGSRRLFFVVVVLQRRRGLGPHLQRSVPHGNVIDESAQYPALFEHIIGSPLITLSGLALFLLLNVLVIASGIRKGIEKANKYLMPLLFIFFIILVIRAVTLDGAVGRRAIFPRTGFFRHNCRRRIVRVRPIVFFTGRRVFLYGYVQFVFGQNGEHPVFCGICRLHEHPRLVFGRPRHFSRRVRLRIGTDGRTGVTVYRLALGF